jgi:hypothetical protein
MNYSYLVHKFRNIHESVHAALTGVLNIKEKPNKYSKKRQKINVLVAYDNFTIRSVANRVFVFVFLRVKWGYLLRKQVSRLLNRRRPEWVQKPEITRTYLYARYFKLIFFILTPLVNYLKQYIKYCFYYHKLRFKVINVHFLFVK